MMMNVVFTVFVLITKNTCVELVENTHSHTHTQIYQKAYLRQNYDYIRLKLRHYILKVVVQL